MELKILSLNCQRGYQPGLQGFLERTLEREAYDFLLLQEVATGILPFLASNAYQHIRSFNDEIGEESEVTIAYRKNFKLAAHGFKSFASIRKDPSRGFAHPSFAFMWGEFTIGNDSVRVGSVHLHSGTSSKARLAELGVTKNILVERPPMPTLFAGDFNTGYPGEAKRFARFLEPEFSWMTRRTEPTLDSRFTENAPHLPNRIAATLGFFNISIPLWTDHFFLDKNTTAHSAATCRVLPDRVSDHSPVELILT